MYEPVFRLVEELGLKTAIAFPGYVAPRDMALWYSAADVFAYPSLYEGFGLPPLEAMACGTPVITSNVSALPEVVGTAGKLLDPEDPCAWAEAMQRVLSDTELHADMSAAGIERAKEFSWRRTAESTAKLYRDVIRNRKKRDV